jgi:hypothetical protein
MLKIISIILGLGFAQIGLTSPDIAKTNAKNLVNLLKSKKAEFCGHADAASGKNTIRAPGAKYCDGVLAGYLAKEVCENFAEDVNGKAKPFNETDCDQKLKDTRSYDAAKNLRSVHEIFDEEYTDRKGKSELDTILCPFLRNTMSGNLLTIAQRYVGCK